MDDVLPVARMKNPPMPQNSDGEAEEEQDLKLVTRLTPVLFPNNVKRAFEMPA